MRYSCTKQARASPLTDQLLHITGSVLLVQVSCAEGTACRHSTSHLCRALKEQAQQMGSVALGAQRRTQPAAIHLSSCSSFSIKNWEIKITHESFQSNKRLSSFDFRAVSHLREASREKAARCSVHSASSTAEQWHFKHKSTPAAPAAWNQFSLAQINRETKQIIIFPSPHLTAQKKAGVCQCCGRRVSQWCSITVSTGVSWAIFTLIFPV